MKYLFFTYLLEASFFYAQNRNEMIQNLGIQKHIEILENRINYLIKKEPKLSNIKGLKQFHILLLNSNTYKKEDFANGSFLHQLEQCSYYDLSRNRKHNTQYIMTETFIMDSIGKFMGVGDARMIMPISNYYYPATKLAKMMFDKKFDIVFSLENPFSMMYKVAIKSNILYALTYNTNNKLVICTWDEFMKCCFDKWLNNHPEKNKIHQ